MASLLEGKPSYYGLILGLLLAGSLAAVSYLSFWRRDE